MALENKQVNLLTPLSKKSTDSTKLLSLVSKPIRPITDSVRSMES